MECRLEMRTIEGPKTGSGSGATGYVTTPQWIMAVIFVGFVVVGFRLRKSRWTIPNQEMQRTCLQLIIFNQPMDIVTIEKAVKDGSRESAEKPTSS